MGLLIVSLIIGALWHFGVIGDYVCLSLLIGSVIWVYAAAGLYFKFGFLKFFYHGLLGWHTPNVSPKQHDGCSYHATCKHCAKRIMQDSQGNWFKY